MTKSNKRLHEVIFAMDIFQRRFLADPKITKKIRPEDNYVYSTLSCGEDIARNLAVISRLSNEPCVLSNEDPGIDKALKILAAAHEDFRKLHYKLISLVINKRMRRGVLVYLGASFADAVDDYLWSLDPSGLTGIISIVEYFRNRHYVELQGTLRGPAIEEANEFFELFDELWFDMVLEGVHEEGENH